MREIVLDTETTGLDPSEGHRLVEIACLELSNGVPTGAEFVRRVNPERAMDAGAYRIHGISEADLAGAPVFGDIVQELLDFIGDAPLVIHNAEFDLRFLNMELGRCSHPPIPAERAIDTLQIARRRFAGGSNSLDGLCKRFAIDASARVKHGARLDAELLAEVYMELSGGRQKRLGLVAAVATAGDRAVAAIRVRRPPRPHAASEAELAAHAAFLGRIAGAIWRR
ncbi:MAG: DNA polymerase III subunit epsilon [Alphaproteobacteria bacterium]